jgi:hypothetical protein
MNSAPKTEKKSDSNLTVNAILAMLKVLKNLLDTPIYAGL